MAISNKTASSVIEILLKHNIDNNIIKEIIEDLSKVEGNKSFKDSITKLISELNRK